MNKIEITVKAPTQSGKSIIMDRIEKTVKNLGCKVYSPGLEEERRSTDFDKPLADWERDMLKRGFVELKEVNLPRALPEGKQFAIELEFKPQNFCVGAFWQRKDNKQHLWICVLPMLPIHIQWVV